MKFLSDKDSVNGAKQANFEVSTVGLVLQQLGFHAKEIRKLKDELAEGFGWSWLNDQGLVGATCGSTRAFNFEFFELLTRPAKHPITLAVREFIKDQDEPHCLVFNVYDYGRWVATNLATGDDSSLHVVTNGFKFNVLPFTGFFANRWKQS